MLTRSGSVSVNVYHDIWEECLAQSYNSVNICSMNEWMMCSGGYSVFFVEEHRHLGSVASIADV